MATNSNAASMSPNVVAQFFDLTSQVQPKGFFLTVQPFISFKEFCACVDEKLVSDIKTWPPCSQCSDVWRDISILSKPDGTPVIFDNPPETYPLAFQDAIRQFQRAFKKSPLTDHLAFGPPETHRHRKSSGNFGIRVVGGYHHLFLTSNLPINKSADKINHLIHCELPDLERYIKEWSPNVIKTLLDRFEAKGEEAPGYRHLIGSLRFMNKLHNELALEQNPRMHRAIILIAMHDLLSGSNPENAVGAIHNFSNGGNLAACRDAVSEDAFWKILRDRYNPSTYRQSVVQPTENQLKAGLALVDGDLSCFERMQLSIDDPRLLAILREEGFHYTPTTNSEITVDKLMAEARARATASDATTVVKKTCFDNKKSMSMSEFLKWCATLPPGSKMEYNFPNSVNPIVFGIPTTEKGAKMTKRLAGWSMTNSPQKNYTIGLNSGWCQIKVIAPHPGRWMPQPLETGGDYLCRPNQSLVADGLIVEAVHTHDPPNSCLFAEFFNGEWHALGKTRQELHNQLRIKKLPKDQKPFIGIMLQSVNEKLNNAHFRLTKPTGEIVEIVVE